MNWLILLRLPSISDKPSFILDVGCGSGLSGQVLEEHGHVWLGCDVSRDMLEVANDRIERKRDDAINGKDDSSDNEMKVSDSNETSIASSGDLMHHDM